MQGASRTEHIDSNVCEDASQWVEEGTSEEALGSFIEWEIRCSMEGAVHFPKVSPWCLDHPLLRNACHV